MKIAPIIPDFRYLKVTRTGGILGVVQTLHVDHTLQAAVTDQRAGDHAFELDAQAAQELMTALAQVTARRPGASTTCGADMFTYDIEIAWDDTVYHVRSVDIGADDALHGVMIAANRLINESRDQAMTLHTLAPA